MTPAHVLKTISVKVKPNARISALARADDGTWIAQVKAPPVDGKANAELIALVAAHFGVARSCVAVRTGASGRLKRVQIDADS